MAHDPSPGFFFSVAIPGSGGPDAVFQEVDGISSEMGIENIGQEGSNHFRYQVPESKKYSNLVLSRGIMSSGSPLADWCREIIESGVAQKIEPKTVIVKLLDPNDPDYPLVSWTFYHAHPIKWEIAGTRTEQAEIVVERIELAYSYYEKTPAG